MNQEERQPHALPFALLADEIHAVVPIAATHQRQAVTAESQPMLDRPHAMIVERGRLFRPGGQVVVGFLVRLDLAAFDERNPFVEHTRVADLLDVAAGGQWQPQEVIGDMSAHAASDRRMPPMLNVSFDKLMGGGSQQMLAHQMRLGMDQGHDVLQLIAEPERAARLVITATSPEAAGQGLIEQPAVDQDIDPRIRRFHINGAQRSLPVMPHAFQRSPRRRRRRDSAGSALVLPRGWWQLPEKTRSRGPVPGQSRTSTCIAPHGSSPGPTLPERRVRVIAAGLAAVPLRPKNSVRSPVTVRCDSLAIQKSDPARKLGVIRVASQAAPRSWDRPR